IMEAGKDSALLPIGLGARNTLRLEAKLMLYGNELDDAISPVEAGLKWAMDINKDFIGKGRALREIENKPARTLVGFEMEERAIPRHGYAIFAGDEEVGIVTSGTFAPFLEKYLGLGYVSRSHRKRGTQIEISIRGKNKRAVIVKTPFYKKQYKKN
ncbi:glycine cleavage system aminomethyltransferase GcvT, partial [Candidatus Calescamantes bacterium]|nr:glycine cleavage system aminomethyltransferase GcvT [Candidatus Calescamantes bacterium]